MFSYDIEQGGEHHLDWAKRLDIAIGIAEALVHLHSLSIIYGCVCSYNVLVEWRTLGVVARLLPPTTSGTARLIVRHDSIKDEGKQTSMHCPFFLCFFLSSFFKIMVDETTMCPRGSRPMVSNTPLCLLENLEWQGISHTIGLYIYMHGWVVNHV